MRTIIMSLFCLFGLGLSACLLGGPEGGPGFNLEETDTLGSSLDGDGLPDNGDNCPQTPNATPVDLQVLGAGTTCTTSANCVALILQAPTACNPLTNDCATVGVWCLDHDGNNSTSMMCVTQRDADLDGGGDACDNDDDNDGVGDSEDNCPKDVNTNQANNDLDALGDACDDDDDNDGDLDGADNCVFTPNPGQEDTDNDGIGNACEDDTDGDGIENGDDNCPTVQNGPAQANTVGVGNQTNTDGDSQGDACDDDDDNDTVCDGAQVTGCTAGDDNCRITVNANQADTDQDGIGDACDTDDDNDLVLDTNDNCPLVPNFGQEDIDGDALGDLCDNDMDGDGDLNTVDNCPTIPNPNQENSDGDALGDACDTDCDGDGVGNSDNDQCVEDPDGDGFTGARDCLEGNPFFFPGAPELCDGRDNDCDTIADDNLVQNACPQGQTCQMGRCQVPNAPQCTVDANCPGAAPACEGQVRVTTTGDCSMNGSCTTQVVRFICPNGCSQGACLPDQNECTDDSNCAQNEFCAGGTCYPFVDLKGSTPLGSGGANGGPNADQTADNVDNDGDGYCEVAPCVTSRNPSILVADLRGGDCDDNPSDSATFVVSTPQGSFTTDGSYSNRPGSPEFCEASPGFDNDCDGTPNDGCL